MSRVTTHMTVSLDGFVAGPDQSRDQPLGRGGLAIHRWHLGEPDNEVDVAARDELLAPRGACVMGRNMYGPIRGDWGDEDWRGWWGPEPPYHAPVFVLTHYAHDPIEMAGGTSFHFVTDGFEAALEQAREAAGGASIDISGGASVVRQALQADAVDDLYLAVAPLTLGQGERMLDDLPELAFQPVSAQVSPYATHLHYRRLRD